MERNNHSEVGSNLGPSRSVVAQHPHKNLFLKSGISCLIISYILLIASQMKCAVCEEKCTLNPSLCAGVRFQGDNSPIICNPPSKNNISVFLVFLFRGHIIVGTVSQFSFHLFENHAVWFEELSDLLTNFDAPIH